MEFITIRVVLVCIFLVSVTQAVEERSWHRNSRLEIFSKEKDDGDLTSYAFSSLSPPTDAYSFFQELFHGILSTLHRRNRRDDSNNCGFTNSPQVVQIYVPESKTYLQPIWLNKEVILIAASDHSKSFSSSITSPTTLWRMDLQSNENRYSLVFKDKSSEISSAPTIIDTLSRSPANPSMVTLISADYKYLYVSRNSGNTWNKYRSPSDQFKSHNDLWLSPVHDKLMFIVDNDEQLFMSENYGQSWGQISKPVFQVDIGYDAQNDVEYLFYTEKHGDKNVNWLSRRITTTGHTEVLDKHVYLFVADGKYLFISKHNQSNPNARRMYVSSDFGKSFVMARLPPLAWHQSFVVMTTHEVGAFIHVNNNSSDHSRGTLYISDSTGEHYTVSLEKHLYVKNYVSVVHDFYEVQSARGVYITSVKEDDGHVTSRISFNRGASWSYLRAVTCEGKSCGSSHLHLHMNYSRSTTFFRSSMYALPLSRGTAPHIIMAHGVVGDHLRDHTNPTRVFISDDAGRTWYSSLPPGKYSYDIGDYGNLLYAVQRSVNSTDIWVSHDRGKCFKKFPLDTTGHFVLKGLVGDFKVGSLVSLAFGVPSHANNTSEWIVHAIKFSSALDRPCHKTDYTKVTENDCLLGYKRVLNLTKADAICYNEPNYKYDYSDKEKCECTTSDFECDYGYHKDQHDKCVEEEHYDLSKHCTVGQKTYVKSSNGLRLIPGDLCTNPESFVTFSNATCTGFDYDAGVDYPDDGDIKRSKRAHKAVVGLVLLIIFTIVTAALCVIGIMMYGKRSKSVEPVKYTRYSKLPVDEPDEGNPFEDDDDDEMLK